MTNSRDKGAGGEREFANYLKNAGYPASRGRQYHGRDDAPDVICEALNRFHFEVKRVQNLNIDKALEQSTRDMNSNTRIACVAHRKNGMRWKITVYADDFMKLIDPLVKPAMKNEIVLFEDTFL